MVAVGNRTYDIHMKYCGNLINKKIDYKIRQMAQKELDIALDWAKKEGWNPGLSDAEAFYSSDPKGFFMGFLDDTPISCISAVAYSKYFGFLGLYIVKPEFRGKEYGLKIWNRAIEYLKTQNIGLDGVVSQQENYGKSGFKLAHRNIRFQGKSHKNTIKKSSIVNLSELPFEKILEYDNKFFPSPRPVFLKNWINQPESVSLGVYNMRKLTGLGTLRKCHKGYKIGPLFADNEDYAEDLFCALNNALDLNPDIFLDVPEVNHSALRLVNRHQMKFVFETARMYTKKPPKLPLKKIFGVTSFELG